MKRATSKSPRVRSRREFMRLLAAGSAAVLGSPVVMTNANAAEKPAARSAGAAASRRSAAAAPTATRSERARREPGARPALPEEIEKQKKYLADALKVIRDFPLPPGSPMAFAFRALPRRGSRRTG